jgi:hypothetical protein
VIGNGRGVKGLLDLLRRESFDLQPNGHDADLLESIGRMHSRKLRNDERTFYREHLAWGGENDSTGGRQRALADILSRIDTPEFGFAEFRAVQKAARKNDALAIPLEKIGRLERLISPAALLFGFLQDRDGQTRAAVAKQIAATWKRPLAIDVEAIRDLTPDIQQALQSQAEVALWLDLAGALSGGRYERVIDVLVAINGSVMQRRHGAAAWIGIDPNGKIRVRLADERAELVPVTDAEDRWRSTYFINALWRVSREVTA